MYQNLQICCSDGQYVCISRDQNKWLIYDTKTIEVTKLLNTASLILNCSTCYIVICLIFWRYDLGS